MWLLNIKINPVLCQRGGGGSGRSRLARGGRGGLRRQIRRLVPDASRREYISSRGFIARTLSDSERLRMRFGLVGMSAVD